MTAALFDVAGARLEHFDEPLCVVAKEQSARNMCFFHGMENTMY